MKKKIFSVILIVFVLFCMVSCTFDYDEDLYEAEVLETTVDIGLSESFSFLHASDTHLTLAGENDSLQMRLHARSRSKNFSYAVGKLKFIEQLSAQKKCPIIHTGDLIDFVSEANIARARDFVWNNDCIFVAGNHEFCQKVGDGAVEDAAYRNQSLEKVQTIAKNDIRAYATERGGVTFVFIDNGYYLIDEEQLAFLKEHAANGPTILCMHVPLYCESLYDKVMETESCAYLMNVPEDKMKSYPESRYTQQKADEVTAEAYQYILAESNIKAVFCGHVHFDYQCTLTENLTQYVIGTESVRFVTLL